MNLADARAVVRDPESIRRDPFAAAKVVAWSIAQEESADVHDVVLHALEHRDAFGPARQILEAAVRELGLFPYLNADALSAADQVAYEFHRPRGLPRVVFHRAQARVYRDLMRGENVVLSAPTSFGKSLLIDAVVASGQYRQLVIVVPTLALIDETRRRLAAFSHTYKIITHSMQAAAEQAIYVLTQERVVDREFERVDFFVIDEFYKLSPTRDDGERAALLNHAFYKLKKLGGQFLLIGPAIKDVPPSSTSVSFKFVHETFTTVASELHKVAPRGDEMAALRDLVKTLDGPTIVFCSSPNRAAEVSEALAEGRQATGSRSLRNASAWLSTNYHPNWHLTRALSHSIGVHHGRIPRALAQFVVRAFNDDRLKTLVCTSTLIEGVNTKARNVIILDNKINQRRFDFFTFNNIRGRSGRMLQHFVGHVYLFHPEPTPELPIIDFPAFTQSEAASDALLLQLDEDDLTGPSSRRLEQYRDQDLVPWTLLRENAGLNPAQQLAFARDVADNLDAYHPLLAWRGFPNWDQLVFAADCMWRHFAGGRLGAGSARSARHLALRIRRLQDRPSTRALIDQERSVADDPDAAVQSVLDFLRLWATFHFPRLLRAMDAIQRHLCERAGRPAGNYTVFAAQVEALFLPPYVMALEEYGVPIEIGRRLTRFLRPQMSLDEALGIVRRIPADQVSADPFEQELLQDSQKSM
jgi:hypothetical protein